MQPKDADTDITDPISVFLFYKQFTVLQMTCVYA